VDDVMERPERERPQVESKAILGQALQQRFLRFVLPRGEEEADTLVSHAAGCIRQDLSGCTVEPLNVVNRHDHRAFPSKSDHRTEEAGRDCSLLEWALRLRAQQSGLQGRALHAREPGGRDVERIAEQIPERDIRELRLAFSGARHEDAKRLSSRLLDPCLPDNRLPDARLSGDYEGLIGVWYCGEKVVDEAQLRVTTDGMGHSRPF
jgi:hypothetical protein